MSSLHSCTILEQIKLNTQWLLETATANNIFIFYLFTLCTSFFFFNKLHNAQVKGYLLGTRSVTVWLCKYTLQYCHQKSKCSQIGLAFSISLISQFVFFNSNIKSTCNKLHTLLILIWRQSRPYTV